MRVISGISKGHKLKVPKGKNTRPTEDKVKESLFNILGPIEADSVVLDLFAGSGSIGIEFLSRGAEKAYFVDKSYESINIINENLKHTKLEENAMVIKGNSLLKLDYFKESYIKFDYIYIDPPYKSKEMLFKVLKFLDNESILKSKGLIIVEHDNNFFIEKENLKLKVIDSRQYGNKIISFLKEDLGGK